MKCVLRCFLILCVCAGLFGCAAEDIADKTEDLRNHEILETANAPKLAKAPPPFEAFIPQMMRVPNAVDSNQDGELSAEEINVAGESLRALDINNDGVIDRKEIGAWEPNLPLLRVHHLTNILDADGDVRLSGQEIDRASLEIQVLDRNGDGYIDKGELALGRPLVRPIFTTRRLSYQQWARLNAYSEHIAGPLPPGKDERAEKGYMLIHDGGDFNQVQRTTNTTYLLNEQGEKVHEWTADGHFPEASISYLLPNGGLLRTLSRHHWVEDKHFPVGAASTIEIVDKDSRILWDFTMSEPERYSFHHDVKYMPNGNILAIRYTGFTKDKVANMGWDPKLAKRVTKTIQNRINKDGPEIVWLDSILELEPNFSDGSTQIVWQWNSWDHFVQGEFPQKPNFGDVKNRAKINVNYLNLDKDVPFNAGQFFHINAIDYNPELDMIMLSVPTYGEIWFIDHSATMSEAASDKGGQYGKGGDLLYRWGNDESFGGDVRDDSYLYWQHNAHWIKPGLPGAGNVLIYNNGSRRNLDGTYMTAPPKNIMSGSYSNLLEVDIPLNPDGRFDKNRIAKTVWSWESQNKADYFSPFMSGAQRLPNGNTIFCRAYDKYITEVTPEGEKVMDFSLAGWGRLHRIHKYPRSYSGLPEF